MFAIGLTHWHEMIRALFGSGQDAAIITLAVCVAHVALKLRGGILGTVATVLDAEAVCLIFGNLRISVCY